MTGLRHYLDTNAIIGMVEKAGEMSSGQRSLVLGIADGELEAETSELTLAESLVKPMADRDTALVERYLRVLAPDSGIEVRAVSREVLVQAARIRAEKRVKLPDAIHLATAQASGCDRFVSNDGRLAKAWPNEFVLWGEI